MRSSTSVEFGSKYLSVHLGLPVAIYRNSARTLYQPVVFFTGTASAYIVVGTERKRPAPHREGHCKLTL
jgi:hypothetical protein